MNKSELIQGLMEYLGSEACPRYRWTTGQFKTSTNYLSVKPGSTCYCALGWLKTSENRRVVNCTYEIDELACYNDEFQLFKHTNPQDSVLAYLSSLHSQELKVK